MLEQQGFYLGVVFSADGFVRLVRFVGGRAVRVGYYLEGVGVQRVAVFTAWLVADVG